MARDGWGIHLAPPAQPAGSSGAHAPSGGTAAAPQAPRQGLIGGGMYAPQQPQQGPAPAPAPIGAPPLVAAAARDTDDPRQQQQIGFCPTSRPPAAWQLDVYRRAGIAGYARVLGGGPAVPGSMAWHAANRPEELPELDHQWSMIMNGIDPFDDPVGRANALYRTGDPADRTAADRLLLETGVLEERRQRATAQLVHLLRLFCVKGPIGYEAHLRGTVVGERNEHLYVKEYLPELLGEFDEQLRRMAEGLLPFADPHGEWQRLRGMQQGAAAAAAGPPPQQQLRSGPVVCAGPGFASQCAQHRGGTTGNCPPAAVAPQPPATPGFYVATLHLSHPNDSVGVSFEEGTAGVRLIGVQAESAAARAGLRPGMCIRNMAGMRVSSEEELLAARAELAAAQVTSFEVGIEITPVVPRPEDGSPRHSAAPGGFSGTIGDTGPAAGGGAGAMTPFGVADGDLSIQALQGMSGIGPDENHDHHAPGKGVPTAAAPTAPAAAAAATVSTATGHAAVDSALLAVSTEAADSINGVLAAVVAGVNTGGLTAQDAINVLALVQNQLLVLQQISDHVPRGPRGPHGGAPGPSGGPAMQP
eukprot:TRINITY_DN5584_c0_g1_i1.p1 TRINITY_DN5584_c0_g1~~TRINITY_DN5584_c0_g1_i1.p1  ORF type:complete len:623 (+),score=96.70 TRINITY_DN5584_c0_g1_i1:111-1871(+)